MGFIVPIIAKPDSAGRVMTQFPVSALARALVIERRVPVPKPGPRRTRNRVLEEPELYEGGLRPDRAFCIPHRVAHTWTNTTTGGRTGFLLAFCRLPCRPSRNRQGSTQCHTLRHKRI